MLPLGSRCGLLLALLLLLRPWRSERMDWSV
jgi:hypothetical protein